MAHIGHPVPGMSVRGTLSTLAATLDLTQYRLLRGLLCYNVGECLDDLQPPHKLAECRQGATTNEVVDMVWTWTWIHLELVDVSVFIVPSPDLMLACVNLIKSQLTVESYSDRTQDVDLVSQQILITDTRFQDEPANKRANVFTNILQPIHMSEDVEKVQAQVHHRRRQDLSKFTILLNNMRLMAILDWWEAVRDFIMENPENSEPVMECARKTEDGGDEWADEVPIELKLNITDSEVVVVEDPSQWDTNAVILKSTTVITYRAQCVERPVSLSLNHCEVFSCILGMEDETALSIIDPLTVNMEIVLRTSAAVTVHHLLQVQMVHLSLRLSYYDVLMFAQMLQSLPQQTQWGRSQNAEPSSKPANFCNQMSKLSALGFRTQDCVEALDHCHGQLDDAALWLTQYATPSNQIASAQGSPAHSAAAVSATSPFSFTQLEVRTECLSMCVIDDCRDADVPLVELSLRKLALQQDLDEGCGTAHCTLAGDYYNRVLSGWEPFLEPWNCVVSWEHSLSTSLTRDRLQVHITSQDALNVNITSTLVDLYRSVKDNWTQDYYNPKDRCETMFGKLSSPAGFRRRSPFVPFALRNDTGLRLWYTTKTTTSDSVSEHQLMKGRDNSPEREPMWEVVDPGDTVPFSFEERGKRRHLDTHKLLSHQLSIRVEGWRSIDPVTVDRVGVFFRQAVPDFRSDRVELPAARVVLDVSLEGSARKLVRIRSALLISNQLAETVELKLDNTHINTGKPLYLTVAAGAVLPVPLSHALAQLWVRPLDWTRKATHYHAFCSRALAWQHVSRPGETIGETRLCHSNCGLSYRFCAVIRRELYPSDRPLPLAPPLHNMWTQPAHTITLASPMRITNLLPYELHYMVREVSAGCIQAGHKANVHEVDIDAGVDVSFHLDNFPRAGLLSVPPNAASFAARLRLWDADNRRLNLIATVTALPGMGLRVSVHAPFWLVNKTGLALVFRQEGIAAETAGQYEEHEVARMVAPLLFSFADHDTSPTVVARIGSRVHTDGVPQWCRHFNLQPGIQVRRLRVAQRESRPDLVYMIGVDIRPGRGRYRATNIVTLSAHYQLHNKSSYRIQLAQKCFASTVSGLSGMVGNVQAQASVPYAWDEPSRPPLHTLVAPGGNSHSYDLSQIGETYKNLTYENFIYIAFTGTFNNVGVSDDPLDVECQQLVLDVPDNASGRVVLIRKQHGARSQLWRMSAEGQLQHEGSSPPRAVLDKILVLDISSPAPQPAQCTSLALRRPDKRRQSTQTWRFTEEGRLCCVHNNMCVQAKDGFFGLRTASVCYC